ncbi:MAG: Nramp family divalent metal transporter, partial [Microgenomates group bacterium]
IFTGKKERITLEGTTFECTPKNLKRFRLWWKRINIEHAIVFWATGAITMIILSLLAYTTVFGNPESAEGIRFVVSEAQVIAEKTFAILGTLFLFIAAAMLFSTQFSVMDATSRIMSENLVILSQKRFKIEKLPIYFYIFLWVQILAGVIIFSLGFTQPLTLVIIGATLNAVAMFFYTGLVLWLNLTNLDKRLRPSFLRIFAVSGAFAFYGIFSFFTILQNIPK